MSIQCPHCHQDLNLSPAQEEKVQKALAALQPGKVLRLTCPHCKQGMELEAPAAKAAKREKSAGGVMQDLLYSSLGEKSKTAGGATPRKASAPPPEAPRPPDTTWLDSGEYEAEEWVEDIETALVLMPQGEAREPVIEALQELGYQITSLGSSAEAMERMRFANFSAVIFHPAFEGNSLADSAFHEHMKNLAMEKRRFIYYVLIGPDFQTLYDLEALAQSANLVVNDREVKHMRTILKKGLHDYEELFNPLIMMLREHGKR